MKHFRISLLVFAIMVCGAGMAFAQLTDSHNIQISISGVYAIDLNDDNQITLSTVAPALAGDSVTGSSDNSKHLYYTVLTTANQSVTASISAGAVPAGTSVDLVVDNVAAKDGTSSGTITLTGIDQDIIDTIGSTATGRLDAAAPRLTYTLQVDDENALVIGNSVITVLLTITNL